MIKVARIRLKPTEKQEILMWKSVGIARFSYNWGLNKKEEYFNKDQRVSCRTVRNEFIKLKQLPEYEWLKEVSSKVISQAFEDLDVAYKRYFKGISNKPRHKAKKKAKPSFYARPDSIKFEGNIVKVEKLGKIICNDTRRIPKLTKYVDPRITYDGKYWYLSLGFEHENQVNELTSESIGIDLGIKDLAIVSNLDKPIKNINKTKKMKQLEKKLHRLQRSCARKYKMNNEVDKYNKTNNIVEIEKKIKLVYRKMTNIRLNHIHQATAMIIKTKPSRVVMETLNVIGMTKNRHLAKALQEQKLYEFKYQMKYKCEFNGIELVEADRFFPSSKMCSCCGNVKKTLKLRERTYRCEECGLVEDRDKNASINLANYNLVN